MVGGSLWAVKYIRLVFVWASSNRIALAGLPRARNIPSCWKKTARSGKLVVKNLPEAAISKVEIERFPPNQVRVTDSLG